jgi:hypothetical protein
MNTPRPPQPPPTRVLLASPPSLINALAPSEPCLLCGSSMMRRRWIVFGPSPGCMQSECKNFGGDRAHVRAMAIRKLAARLWFEEGGHMPYRNGGIIHEFMVTYPPTRMEYEARAEEMLYKEYTPCG